MYDEGFGDESHLKPTGLRFKEPDIIGNTGGS